MVQPKCTICGLDLMSNEGRDTEGKVIELQVSYWMHDPRSISRDIKITTHFKCWEKVKKIFPNFDNPTQDKIEFPVIEDDIVKMKVVKDFLKLIKI